MDILLLFAIYVFFSAFSSSKKAKQNRANRPKGEEPTLPPMTKKREERPVTIEPKRKVAKKRESLFDLPKTSREKTAKTASTAKRKKVASKVFIPEEAPAKRKAPITPVTKDEHMHTHKKPVETSLTKRTSSLANRHAKNTGNALEVQILADAPQDIKETKFKLKTDQEALVEGIVWSEILTKPKALRR